MKKDLKNAVTYARVARRESDTSDTCIEQQQQLLKDFAGTNGFLITDHFYDIGIVEPFKREGFQEMIKAIERSNGGITHILIVQPDRISRNAFEFIKTETLLNKTYGATIVSARGLQLSEFLPYPNNTNTYPSYESQNNPAVPQKPFSRRRRTKTITGTM